MSEPNDISTTFRHLAERATEAGRRADRVLSSSPSESATASVPSVVPEKPLRVGLVLAGGGAKGAYELGVLDCLAEMGTRVSAIAGTSIGALNGAVLAAEPSLPRGVEHLTAFWERFSSDSGVPPFPARGVSLAAEETAHQLELLGPGLRALRERVDLLERIIDEAVDFAAVRAGCPLWVATYPLKHYTKGLPPRVRRLLEVHSWLAGTSGTILRLNDRPEATIRDAVLASAALPFIFPARVIDGCAYIDGGIGGRNDKTPVRAFAEHEGCDLLIVVHLNPEAVVKSDTIRHLTRIDIRPSVPIVPPGPLGSLTALLAFSPDRVRALRSLGREDAQKRFKEIHEIAGTRTALSDAESEMLQALDRLRRGT